MSVRPCDGHARAHGLDTDTQARCWKLGHADCGRLSEPSCTWTKAHTHTHAHASRHARQYRTCTMARARLAGSPLLKMPEPTNTPSIPSCIMSAASAGVATPPAAKLTTGRRPRCLVCRTSSTARSGARQQHTHTVSTHAHTHTHSARAHTHKSNRRRVLPLALNRASL